MINFAEDEKYGIRKSIVFYFYDSINVEKVGIVEEIVKTYIEQFQVEFNKKRVNDEYEYRNIRGGWQKIFHKVYDNVDFDNNSHIVEFLEGDAEHLLRHRMYLLLWQGRHSSILIFQCDQLAQWKKVYQYMEYVNKLLRVQFASAGYDIVYNPWTGIAPYAVKRLRSSRILNSDITEWNSAFTSRVKSGICCPNIIQILSPDFCSKLDLNRIAASEITNTSMAGKNLMIDILDRVNGEFMEPEQSVLEQRMDDLYQLLKPIVVEYERTVYLKPDAWEQRMHRFEHI
ncbi:MAG: hypothetical protein K2K74_03215 [Lachnospiraceae bacterium]|nr:hypothetical protein [Lachnospiraceae bacterium]